MPIVFVHGVNNRKGDGYEQNEVARNAFLREIVGPALGLAPSAVQIFNPYWGDDGARFRWNMAVLPDPSVRNESFGPAQDEVGFETAVELAADAPPAPTLVDLAKKDMGAAVDLLYGASLAAATDEDDARNLARSYASAMRYARTNPSPPWLSQVTDDNFADVLAVEVEKMKATGESFGAGELLDGLKEGLSRLKNAMPAVASNAAVILGRKKLNARVTRFVGDVFAYLAERGGKERPGAIVQDVLGMLRQADAARRPGDDQLIVIAHSFGGEICYDIFTYYAADMSVDCWITVGSQVGLFEEMKLYQISSDKIPPNPPAGKVAKPEGVKRWLNVFDTNDVVSYRAEPVFDGAHDFSYDTGYATPQAHGGYFARPSFYQRLAAHLAGS